VRPEEKAMKTRGSKNVCKFGLLLVLAMTSMAWAQAPVPFVEFNAATSAGVTTNGSVIGPNYYFGTLAAEATGRKAVVLSGRGEFVSFTLTAPANAVTIHYAIPDAPAGNGMTQPLSLYLNGALTTSLSLTSAYSWLYGAYTFTKTPGLGMPGELTPHDFYNDVRFMFSSTLPAGTVVKLQVDPGDNAPWYIINTADFEVAPAPIAAPAGSIDVTQSPYNADNTGARDSTTALQNAINAASTFSSHPIVYLPAGTYTISSPLMLGTGNVTIEGAGEWYTVLTGSHVEFAGNISPATPNVNISNLAIFGNVAVRNDGDGSVNGFNGGFSNSTISNVWIQNTKVGAWIVGPATNLTFDHMRIMDLKADGINFNAANGPVTSSTIQNSFFRNTQDDGIAMWAENAPDTNITITHNTVLSPGLANNIAIYGAGGGDLISNNLLEDPVTRGSCIHDGLRFSAVATSGPITIQNNTLQRCGQYDPGFFFGVGAIWFWPLDSNMGTAVNLSGNTIQDSPYSGYMFLGPNSTSGVTVSGDTLTNVGTFVAHTQGNGAATISNTAATGVADGGFLNLGCTWNFTLTATGDTGWTSTPICAIPPANPLWVYPDIVTFQTTPGARVTHQVAVINAAYEATTIGPISTSGGFTVSADPSSPCGSSLVAATYGGAPENGWCIVDVTFDGSGSGITPGTLTIPNSAGSTVSVMLVGSTGGNTTNNPPTVSPASLTFGFLLVGQTSAAQNVTLTNPPGGAAFSITSIATSSGFSQTNNCGSILAGGVSCTISVKFAPTAAGVFNGSLAIANSATSTPITVSLSGTAFTSTTNLALGATTTSSSTQSGFPASNVNDNNTSTYWESLDNAAFPQWIDLNFGQVLSLGSVTLNLPPLTSWTTRTETFSVLGSTNGTNYTTLIGSASYTFNPATGNTVSFNLPSGTSATNLRLNFTANTGWPAAQLSEFQVFPGTISCTAGVPAPPTGLTATAVSSTQINLSWMASSTSGVTYSVFRSTTSGFTPSAANQIAGGLTGTTFSDTGLNASTTYFYVVQAVNCAGTASSTQASATTPSSCTAGVPAPPTGLTAMAVSSAQINLSWTASSTSGVTYSVFRSTTSGFTPSAANQIASGLTGTTFSDTGLKASTTYFYIVQAVNCAGTASSAQASATTPSGGGSGTVIQINSGGPASGTWVADTDVAGGNTGFTGATIDTSLVANPAPQNVYQTVRWGSFTYTIPNLTAGAAYTVNLHFAEITWTTIGQRVFNVLVNGKNVLNNFDIIAAAGAPNKAVVESVATTANSSGQIVIQFTVGTVDNPEISGIEVIKGIASNANLSLGATATSNSIASGFPASNANDGNPRSYWESLNSSAFPQWVDLNFGSIQNIGHVTLRLPPLTTWATRTETLSVQVSTDGTTYTTVVPSAGYTFNPATGNTVSFSLPAGTTARNVRLNFTANTGWPAAQVSEFQVFP